MPRAGLDDIRYPDTDSAAPEDTTLGDRTDSTRKDELRSGLGNVADRRMGPRRTPRKSIIVVLPDDHVLSPEVVAERLPQTGDNELVDVIVACAGEPAGLAALMRRVRDVQVLLAPKGTSPEDLRELAIRRTPGDIVTLLSGVAIPVTTREFEMFRAAQRSAGMRRKMAGQYRLVSD